MNQQEIRSILTVALLGAFADGMKDERERAAVKRVADALGPDAGFDLPAL
jgi:tellurite resistance protein